MCLQPFYDVCYVCPISSYFFIQTDDIKIKTFFTLSTLDFGTALDPNAGVAIPIS